MVQVNKRFFYLFLIASLMMGGIAAFAVTRGDMATVPAGTQIAGVTETPWSPTRDPSRIIVRTDEAGTPWWRYDNGESCCWFPGDGPTATPTVWATWTPQPKPDDIVIVNTNFENHFSEVENRTNVPIMFVDKTTAVRFTFFDPVVSKEYQKDVSPGRADGGLNITCVIFPGERGLLFGWPGYTPEESKRMVVHYQTFGVTRPDLADKRDYIHMPFENFVWKAENGELSFSFDMETFDEYRLYQKKGEYYIMGTLFLYDVEGNLIDVLFRSLRFTGGGHIDGTSNKGPNHWGWRSEEFGKPVLEVDEIKDVRLLIEREEQPDCVRFADKTYVYTPTPK
jgi:hypothetical protein